MKNGILTLFLSLLCMYSLAQNEGLSYQATVRSSAGAAVGNQNVSLRFTIMSGSATGPVVYAETQTVMTTSLGLINTTIGTGTTVSGNWNTMNWNSGSLYLKVEADVTGGSNYVDLGTTMMGSVAFSKQSGGITLYANGSGNASKMIVTQSSVNANTGIRYNDSAAKIEFISNGNAKTSVDLGTGNLSASGNVSAAGDLMAGGNVNATGSISAGGSISATGLNLTGGVTTNGTISTSGSISSGNNVSVTNNITAGGNITATGNISGANLTLSGEVNKSATGTANLLPIAYGTISATGSILSGSGNFSVNKTATGTYSISINNETYVYSNYTAVGSVSGSLANLVTSSVSGNLLINTYTIAGVAADAIFQFIVYKN
jgi:uncharacterized protein (DUF342 family)